MHRYACTQLAGVLGSAVRGYCEKAVELQGRLGVTARCVYALYLLAPGAQGLASLGTPTRTADCWLLLRSVVCRWTTCGVLCWLSAPTRALGALGSR